MHQSREVVPLELFFDLVYAFAFSQLSHHLLEDLSWRHALETLVLLLTVVTAWAFTSWVATHVRVDESPAARRMMIAVTLFGLFMNAMIPGAFGGSGWAFALPMLAIQLGRTVWCVLAVSDPLYRAHYARMLVWLLATTPLWLIGAAADPEARLGWWATATVIELVGTWLAHPLPGQWLRSDQLEFDGEHMLERCRLFVMIALGETVLATGSAIAAVPISLMTVLMGAAALLGNIALFWLLFGVVNRRVSAHMHVTGDPVRSSRHAMNIVMIVVAGLIAVAVANEKIIDEPEHPLGPAIGLLLFGGPALILVSIGWYLWAILGLSPRANLFAAMGMALLGLLVYPLPHGVQLILSSSLLLAIAWFGNRKQSLLPGMRAKR